MGQSDKAYKGEEGDDRDEGDEGDEGYERGKGGKGGDRYKGGLFLALLYKHLCSQKAPCGNIIFLAYIFPSTFWWIPFL